MRSVIWQWSQRLIVVAFLAGSASVSAQTEQIAITGDAAPLGDGTFNGFEFPALNANGQAAFLGYLTGTANDYGIFRGSGGALTQIARTGDAAPLGDGIFDQFSSPVLNASGQTAFWGGLTDTANDYGIFRGSGGALTQIARKGDAAPLGDGIFSQFNNPVLNANGQTAFWGYLTGTANDRGIFRGSGGALTQIARTGDAAPLGDGTFDAFSSSPTLNANGQAAFWGSLTGTANDRGIFRGSGGALTQIARTGDAAPAGDGTFHEFGNPSLNAGGQVAFRATLSGTDDDEGIYLGDGQETLQVARKGQSQAGSTFANVMHGDSGLNDYGQVAYRAGLSDGRQGIFVFTPELHYRSTSSGYWDSSGNWTVGLQPAQVHNVSVDPAVGLTVTGPGSATTVKSLTVNASGPNPAELKLQSSGPITASDGVTLGAKGRLTGSGQISGIFSGAAGSVIRPDGDMALGSLSEVGFSTAGALTVGSHTVTLQSADGARLDGNTTLNGGKLVADTISNSGALSGSGEIDAVVENYGQINLIGQEMIFHRLVNNAPAVGQIAGRNAIMHFDGDLNNDGSLAFSFGTSDVFGKVNNLINGRIVVSGNSQVTFYDDVDNNGREIRVSTGSTAVFFGAVSGDSSFTGGGTTFFEGDLRPGNSPAAVTFEGDVGFGSSASLVMELAGILPGAEYDKITVDNSLALGGLLDVQLIDGFVPKAGNTFDLLDWGTLVGEFDAVHLPTLPNGLAWNATSLYSTGQIGVVPEPGSLVLMVTAGLGALCYAWRRRRS